MVKLFLLKEGTTSSVGISLKVSTIDLKSPLKKLKLEPGGLCLSVPLSACVGQGDTVQVENGEALGTPQIGSSIVTPVAGFDLDAALETIDKLSKLDPKIVFCSHGGVSREAARLIQSVRANTKAYGDIILEAMSMGEEKGQIVQRLEAYQAERAQGEYQLGEHHFENIITWYVAHFNRKGVI